MNLGLEPENPLPVLACFPLENRGWRNKRHGDAVAARSVVINTAHPDRPFFRYPPAGAGGESQEGRRLRCVRIVERRAPVEYIRPELNVLDFGSDRAPKIRRDDGDIRIVPELLVGDIPYPCIETEIHRVSLLIRRADFRAEGAIIPRPPG